MEDRQPAGLWLEMLDGDNATALEAATSLVQTPAVSRATVFANCRRDRADLPRTLPEFDLLVVAETDDPGPVVGRSGYSFRRYPRPSQGICTGRPTTGIQLVLISPRDPAQAQALRDWGDFVHLRHIAACAVPGFTTITPYENIGAGPRYLHFYEMDCADPEAAFQSMTPLVAERLGGGPGHPAFDAWARHPGLWINYVNTFRRVGEVVA